jgi:hypothetical protein
LNLSGFIAVKGCYRLPVLGNVIEGALCHWP